MNTCPMHRIPDPKCPLCTAPESNPTPLESLSEIQRLKAVVELEISLREKTETKLLEALADKSLAVANLVHAGEKISELQAALVAAQKRVEELSSGVVDLSAIVRLENERDQLQAQVAAVTAERDAAQRDAANCRANLSHADGKIAELQDAFKELEQTKSKKVLREENERLNAALSTTHDCTMKQFLLFAGSDYYPYGGWRDFQDSFDSVEDAVEWVARSESHFDWWHAVDLETGNTLKTASAD